MHGHSWVQTKYIFPFPNTCRGFNNLPGFSCACGILVVSVGSYVNDVYRQYIHKAKNTSSGLYTVQYRQLKQTAAQVIDVSSLFLLFFSFFSSFVCNRLTDTSFPYSKFLVLCSKLPHELLMFLHCFAIFLFLFISLTLHQFPFSNSKLVLCHHLTDVP